MKTIGDPPRGVSGAVVLLLLSLLWAAGVLRADLLPNFLPISLPLLEREAIPLAILAVVSSAMLLVRREPRPRKSLLWSSQWIAFGLFVAPALLIRLSHGWTSGLTRAALFTLVPVFAVVVEPHIGEDSESKFRQPRNALAAALASSAGALFVFPVQIPVSVENAAGWLAIILAAACIAWANCCGVRVMSNQPFQFTQSIVALASLSAAAGLFTASAIFERPIWGWTLLAPELLWSVSVELPALLLLFWLMRHVSATRMTSRYVFAPLLAIAVGTLLLQSIAEVRLRTWLGLALMAVGAVWLLIAPDQEVASSAHPLNLIPK